MSPATSIRQRVTRPRILFISSSWPDDAGFGGQLRAFHTADALRKIGELSLAVVGSTARDMEAWRKASRHFDVRLAIEPRICRNETLVQKLRAAFDRQYLNVHGYAIGEAEKADLASLAADFDLVWILNARTPNIIQRWHWPRAHLDLDDVPSTYLGSVARSAPHAPQRWKARVRQQLLRRREAAFRERFTTLSVCSEQDRRYLRGEGRIHVIPNGYRRPVAEPNRVPSLGTPRIGFIGLYSYAPNFDGVRWFLRECWSALRAEIPGIRFRLIGKDSDGPLRPVEPDVDALGWLPDPAAEIATWSLMVVPIRFGGGTRVKLADAFSRKCPVVATSLGAFGYEVENGNQLMLADSPEMFCRACAQLVRDPDLGRSLAERAWTDFLTRWTWDAIEPKIWAAAEDCLRRSSATYYSLQHA